MSYKYSAFKMNGNGTVSQLAGDLPLTGVSYSIGLSTPDTLNATLSPELAYAKTSTGDALFKPWSTLLVVERDGLIKTACIVTDMPVLPESIGMTCVGLMGYFADQPYRGERSFIAADPAALIRHMVSHIQEWQDANLGLAVNGTTTTAKVGVKATADNSEGPYRLAWYETHDVGGQIDEMIKAGGLEYKVDHKWVNGLPSSTLNLAFPRHGTRRTDLRFVVGENIVEPPTVENNGEEIATDVIVLGSGEGAKTIRGQSPHKKTGTLARFKVVSGKSYQQTSQAVREANRLLNWFGGDTEEITELSVVNHPNAPTGSIQIGDDILIQGSREGYNQDYSMWVRVLGIEHNTEDDSASLTVARAEKVSA
jgi:hypothetical protein